jgi:hypothetical protein
LENVVLTELLERPFRKIGARVKWIQGRPRNSRRGSVSGLFLDVRSDRHGEYFAIMQEPDTKADLAVLDVQPVDRHLLLLSRTAEGKHRFLLGHDERHWFVAAIPESTPVSRVRDAKQALKPQVILLREFGLRMDDRDRRVNSRRIWQGEWFYVPVRVLPEKPAWILRNEPRMRSNGGKPHIGEELCRHGGETVYVSATWPAGLTQFEYAALSLHERTPQVWRTLRRNPMVYVRGRVRHPDHKTVVLDGWHQIFSNTEHLSAAMQNDVFLD